MSLLCSCCTYTLCCDDGVLLITHHKFMLLTLCLFCIHLCSVLWLLLQQQVLLSPMSFFNSNPQGRILNRFSNDQGSVDELLPVTAHNAIEVHTYYIVAVYTTIA
jgi:ABC-type multidrug transport system fused ATPase/permease subunit